MAFNANTLIPNTDFVDCRLDGCTKLAGTTNVSPDDLTLTFVEY
jgi:hypothetical protein